MSELLQREIQVVNDVGYILCSPGSDMDTSLPPFRILHIPGPTGSNNGHYEPIVSQSSNQVVLPDSTNNVESCTSEPANDISSRTSPIFVGSDPDNDISSGILTSFVESVPGNGSCLFHSFSALLSLVGDPFHGANSTTLRQVTINVVRNYNDEKLEINFGSQSINSVGDLPRLTNGHLNVTNRLAMMSLPTSYSGMMFISCVRVVGTD